MTRFTGKRALVTGAGAGIGRAVVARLTAEGARVAGLDIAPGGIDADVALACDVADAAAVDAAVAEAAGALGGLDVVCNVAGVGRFAHSHEETAERFAQIVAVNLHGTFHVCRAALPHLLANGAAGGAIVNTASTAGLVGQPWAAAYCASKGGVVMLTKALAVEYVDRGVRVNAVAPGGTATALAETFGQSFPAGVDLRRVARYVSPMGMAAPEDIAAAIVFTAAPEAHYMTGSIVVVDGGIVA